ncbi:MAG: aminodeoxychorismate lyase, partial [Methylococcales bacterium]|nr:aminodeoxychorismate lyase [Methylococcales bacterium]
MSAVIAMWSGGEAISSPILQDRGFHYGDGLFETILFEGGGLQFWQRHLDRLELGCQRLGLQMPALSGVIEHLSQVLPIDVRAVVKLIVTAGITGRGYGRDVTEGGLHCLSYESIDVPDKNSVALSTSPVRLSRQPLLAGLKHLNRLEQVLAKRSLPEGCFEGLMLDTEGLVVEG